MPLYALLLTVVSPSAYALVAKDLILCLPGQLQTAIPASSGMAVPEDIEPWVVLRDCEEVPTTVRVLLLDVASGATLTEVVAELPGIGVSQGVEVPFPTLPVEGEYELQVEAGLLETPRLGFTVEPTLAEEIDGAPQVEEIYQASRANGVTRMALDVLPARYEPELGGLEVRMDGAQLIAAGLPQDGGVGLTFVVPDAEVGDEVCVEVVQRDAAGREAASGPVCSEVRFSLGCSTSGSAGGAAWLVGLLAIMRRWSGVRAP